MKNPITVLTTVYIVTMVTLYVLFPSNSAHLFTAFAFLLFYVIIYGGLKFYDYRTFFRQHYKCTKSIPGIAIRDLYYRVVKDQYNEGEAVIYCLSTEKELGYIENRILDTHFTQCTSL